MACGLPAIATDYPGVRAVVDEGETGLLVPAGDSGAAAEALDRIVDMGADGRRAMGAAGRGKAERLWSLAGAARPHGRGLRRGDRGAAREARSGG